MITLEKLRDLDLIAPLQPGRAAFISAASGLVRIDDRLYIIADDENHLAIFDMHDAEPGRCIQLRAGVLAAPKAQRKKQKADLESLARLPMFTDYPHGALLAMGSGSLPNRSSAFLLALDFAGQVYDEPRAIDLSAWYARLSESFPALNIEAAVVSGQEFCLLQRGGKSGSRNACIRLPLAAVLSSLEKGDQLDGDIPMTMQVCDLGDIDGLPLCFSDAAALSDGRLMFTAITEDSNNSVDDGPCGGAAVGILSRDGVVDQLEIVRPTVKIEGIALRETEKDIEILLVSDDDDPTLASALYRSRFPRA